ncbi:hypothetical protein RRG08_006468 [Elysia crispata]|uniref:Uncharacterized protein n=1 Tax=Elysia crispata TaxID=231223 RepID=A0AAE0YAT0_9GAST|nr:hypothetical protein RRG08_006468 [Elysia crispata]
MVSYQSIGPFCRQNLLYPSQAWFGGISKGTGYRGSPTTATLIPGLGVYLCGLSECTNNRGLNLIFLASNKSKT